MPLLFVPRAALLSLLVRFALGWRCRFYFGQARAVLGAWLLVPSRPSRGSRRQGWALSLLVRVVCRGGRLFVVGFGEACTRLLLGAWVRVVRAEIDGAAPRSMRRRLSVLLSAGLEAAGCRFLARGSALSPSVLSLLCA